MDRRKFLKGFIGAVATVAIASRLAPKFPKFEYKTYSMGFTISREELEEKACADIGARYAEMLVKSMVDMKENIAARVYWDVQTEFLHVEGISREEMYGA